MKTADALASLAALAQDSRLALFRLLVRRGPAGHSAGEIGRRLAIPTGTLSFHLKELARAGLIEARRDGRYIYYCANLDGMNELVGFLTNHRVGGTFGANGAPRAAEAMLRRTRA